MDLMGLQQQAEAAMHELAKKLVALKESEGVLSDGALRNYLQVSCILNVANLFKRMNTVKLIS